MSAPDGSGDSPPLGQLGFPTEPEEFDADPRISFSKVSSKFVLETDDGREFEYEEVLKRWIPVVRPHCCLSAWIARLRQDDRCHCDGLPV